MSKIAESIDAGRRWSLGLRLVTVSYISVGVRLFGCHTPACAIAKPLNARGVTRGGIWTPVQVTAVLRRASCPNITVSRISGESERQNKTSRR